MLIDKKVLNKLCPNYQQEITKLDERFTKASSNKGKRILLLDFAENYLMIKELWDVVFE